jgi:hypothetical protein
MFGLWWNKVLWLTCVAQLPKYQQDSCPVMSMCDKQSMLGCATSRYRIKDVVWIKVEIQIKVPSSFPCLIDSHVMDVVSCFSSKVGFRGWPKL